MTLKSLLKWGGIMDSGAIPVERWHSRWEHDFGHKHYGYHKEKGSAALSALALLAFLFLINVMQQSLNEFNGAANVSPTQGTAVLLRDNNIPLQITADNEDEKLRELKKLVVHDNNKGSVLKVKGDTLS